MKYTLSQEDVAGLNDDQKGAVFEALVTAVFADGKVDQTEIERFEQEIGQVPLGKDSETLKKMVNTARDKVQKLTNREEVVAFIKTIAGRLTAPALREKVWRMMSSVMWADRDLNDNEKNVLAAFAIEFGLTKDQIDAIKKDIKHPN